MTGHEEGRTDSERADEAIAQELLAVRALIASTVVEAAAAESAAAESRAGDSAAADFAAAGSVTGESATAESVTGESAAGESVIGDSAAAEGSGRPLGKSWVAAVETDEGEIRTAAEELIREAEGNVDVVLAAEAAHVGALHSVLSEWLRSGGENVRTRVLCAQNSLDWNFVRRHARDGRPLEVRVARIPLLAAFIVDGRAALVCADSAVGRRASAIRDPGVIETLQTLFDGIWRNAVVVNEQVDLGGHARMEMVRPILEWLRLGVTDEVAARELSVSVRTYRRYVAEIMALLGASSRFQAGVRAAELGLLPANPPGDAPREPPRDAPRHRR
ncbi:LuxR family transcriptional regulator [Streptomyces lonegramiae]|uniref:LuxR family transcriptional regulator n=1 Tax=Streptomyces lonegramiae TaxID=3075524 RepID=A0ABU2XG71_9ACTN|nr:LuxR family transcriptional regulator [Streptomyces sp. DSM 41529]MDT0544090.1 LuxR family transcriptional regulator [Streptomyces sp. DSM 41529]